MDTELLHKILASTGDGQNNPRIIAGFMTGALGAH